MTCLEARREMAADPGHPSEALLAHVADCDGCARALWREQGFDRKLQEAMSVPVPDGLEARLLLAQTTRQRRRLRGFSLAIAAGVVLAVGVAVTWQFGVRPVGQARALNHYVATHLNHEPQALEATAPVNLGTVERLLNEYGLHLSGDVGNIVYVSRCPTPNGTGVHLVVRTTEGPMTFIYMPEQRVRGRVDLESNGYRGYVTRFAQGSAALVGSPSDALEEVGRRLARAIRADEA